MPQGGTWPIMISFAASQTSSVTEKKMQLTSTLFCTVFWFMIIYILPLSGDLQRSLRKENVTLRSHLHCNRVEACFSAPWLGGKITLAKAVPLRRIHKVSPLYYQVETVPPVVSVL
jgi:hypothetical protein